MNFYVFHCKRNRLIQQNISFMIKKIKDVNYGLKFHSKLVKKYMEIETFVLDILRIIFVNGIHLN